MDDTLVLDATLEALRVAADTLAALTLTDLDGRDAAATLLRLDGLAGRLTAIAAGLMPVVEADGWWSVAGARSSTAWLAAAGQMTHARASSLVSTGRAMRDDLPATARAAIVGSVPFDRLQTLARVAVTSPARRAALADASSACAEGFLLDQARMLNADRFRLLVRRWAAAADPTTDERGYAEANDREFVSLSGTTGGFHLSGFLTTEHGATVHAALDAVMRPPVPGQTRTTPQRRARALVDLARLTLDNGLVGTGSAVRPHLSCVVDLDTLQRALGQAASTPSTSTSTSRSTPAHRLPPVSDIERFAVAEILGAGPIPASVLARLACDSEITRVVFGPHSQVIDAGRAERTFSGPRRRAIIARDRTCRYPDCNAPPALGELHHTDHWTRDNGHTNTNTGILLCWHHHETVHQRGIEISRAPTGGWTFTQRDGTTLPRAA